MPEWIRERLVAWGLVAPVPARAGLREEPPGIEVELTQVKLVATERWPVWSWLALPATGALFIGAAVVSPQLAGVVGPEIASLSLAAAAALVLAALIWLMNNVRMRQVLTLTPDELREEYQRLCSTPRSSRSTAASPCCSPCP